MKTEILMAGGLTAVLLPVGVTQTYARGEAQARPNVVIIIADDCSYSDIGCYGAVNNRTPNIDALARDGIRFTNAYNSCSTSVPTRHSLYTGMYPMRHGGYSNQSAIRNGITTMPTYLTELNYRVGLAGKWHVKPLESYPFEEIKGFAKNCLTKNPAHTMEYVNEFIDRDSEQPFCLIVASVNPHVPWTGGDESIYDRDKLVLPPQFVDTPLTRDSYARYLAEIDLLDSEVGDVTASLKERGLYDNTLIMFLSEQGTQLAGAKWTNWYSGVHAAVIARWGGHTTAGESDAIIQYEDILPTLITLAGGTPDYKVLDGRSLLPLLEGKTDHHRRYAFHVHNNIPSGPAYPIRAVSDGHYRLVWNLASERDFKAVSIEKSPWFVSWKESDTPYAKHILNRWYHRPEFELYDITVDPYEMNNLSDNKQYARIMKRLQGVLKKWMKSQNDEGVEADRARNPDGTLPEWSL